MKLTRYFFECEASEKQIDFDAVKIHFYNGHKGILYSAQVSDLRLLTEQLVERREVISTVNVARGYA